MSKYERFNHAKTFLRYHLIFSTKYRRKVLNPIRDDLLAAMKVAQEKNGNFRIALLLSWPFSSCCSSISSSDRLRRRCRLARSNT